MGEAIGATVRPNARDFDGHDIIVGVKRIDTPTLQAIRESGLPWVWDCVDAYPQPVCGEWSRDQSIVWAREKISELKPDAIVWPNQRMAHDIQWDGPQLVLYHHGRSGVVLPIRETIQNLGYEGSERYLGKYADWLPKACEKRLIRFHINPKHLGEMDIVIAVRDGQWNGYPQQMWKSNVKLANAQITGRPFIGHPEAGYLETASGAEVFVSGKDALMAAVDAMKDQQRRRDMSDTMLRKAPKLEDLARAYRSWLNELSKS